MKFSNKTIIILFISFFTLSFATATDINSSDNTSANSNDQSRHRLLDRFENKDDNSGKKAENKKSRKKVAPFREERLDARHDRRSKLHNQLEGNH
ncbi:hypothetical protein [Francisella adeliensis]|nr:hypothetical protein [Francisella adeliensis]MBK2085485.1 hypothetical protein [Francisella adeliensis]MBK2097215.1 hypothetical protein [Francisella adeliensis]QIW11693.1 hypothetical protein FZC43_03110 [Francisella adeliensis]QIW13567.1 hypothetical protein FZC44_03110 [Francisella adeliensis]